MSIPIIYVSNALQSTSFYANVCTPLGIVYLTTTTSSSGKPQQHFGIQGTPSETLFTLQETSNTRTSTITLTASNGTQVTQFHTLALASQAGRGTNLISQTDNGAVAKTTDLDGNLLEVRYERRVRRGSNGGGSNRSSHALRLQRQNSSESHREGTTITTASTAKEAKRVLEWQRTVARSLSDSSDSGEDRAHALTLQKAQPQAETVVSSSTLTERREPPPAAPSAPSLLSQGFQQQQTQDLSHAIPSLMRSVTEPVGAIRDLCKEISSHMPPSTTDSTGLSNNGLIGTILGAAAGAAIAYAMVQSEEPEKRPEMVTHFMAPAYAPQQQVQYQQQMPIRSATLSEQGMMQPMGHDYGHNVLQTMRQHPPPAHIYAEPSQYYSPSGIEVGSQARSKAPSAVPSDYHASKSGSRSEALKHRADGGNSQSGSRVGSSREATLIEQAEQYSSSPKSTHSHHSSRSKAEGSHVSKSSSRQTAKPEPARADTVVSKHSTSKSSASTSRGSEASTVKPSKSSSKSSVSKTPTAVVSEAKSSHTSHSKSSEKSHGIGSVHSVRSEKSERSKHSKAPRSEISYAGTVVPEDSVSQIGSRHSSSRRRQEVYC